MCIIWLHCEQVQQFLVCCIISCLRSVSCLHKSGACGIKGALAITTQHGFCQPRPKVLQILISTEKKIEKIYLTYKKKRLVELDFKLNFVSNFLLLTQSSLGDINASLSKLILSSVCVSSSPLLQTELHQVLLETMAGPYRDQCQATDGLSFLHQQTW